MSILFRIALWFTLILGVVLAGLSVTASQLTSDSLLSELHRDVRERAGELVATVGPTVLAGTAEEASVGTRTIDVFSQLDVYCQVVDAKGNLVASSSNLGKWHLPFQAAPSGELQHELPVGKIPLILDQQPVLVDGQLAGYVIVGRSPSVIYQALGRLRGVL